MAKTLIQPLTKLVEITRQSEVRELMKYKYAFDLLETPVISLTFGDIIKLSHTGAYPVKGSDHFFRLLMQRVYEHSQGSLF